jgi:hypothetical protein
MTNLVPKDFWGNLESDNLKVPHMKIGQGTSRRGQPGQFNFTDGRSEPEIKNAKLLIPRMTRVLYAKEWNAPARCASDDFYSPAPRIQQPISPNCLNCYAKEWGDKDPRKQALGKELGVRPDRLVVPLCKETFNSMFLDGNGVPFFSTFQGTAWKIVNVELVNRLKFNFREVPPYMVAFDIGIKEDPKSANRIFIPTFSNFRVVEGQEAEMMDHYYQMFQSKAAEILAQAHAQMDAEKDAVPF